VDSEGTVRLADGGEIVAIVTRRSVEDLGLKVAMPATALIKAPFVLLAKGEGLKTSEKDATYSRLKRRASRLGSAIGFGRSGARIS
jgi:molybdate transport system regulatory protein